MFFNASERKGVFIVLLLLTSMIVIPTHFLQKDADFFLLPASPAIQDSLISHHYSAQKQKTTKPVELNSADSITLISVRGIGPYYASKILRYRQRLGGFQSVKQLKEVKMTYFNVDSCAHLFTVNPALIRKQDMDTMSFKAVLRHPYLEYEDVQMIFNAKKKYGHVSWQLLAEKKVLATYKLKKIQPYFK